MNKENKILSCVDCPSFSKSAFKDLAPADTNEIDRIRQDFSFTPGTPFEMKRGGQPGFFCLRKGHWKLDLTEGEGAVTVRLAGPGAMIGYAKQSYVGSALEKGSACFIPAKPFLKLQRENVNVSQAIIHMLCEIVDIRDSHLLEKRNTNAKVRVLSVLLNLNKKFGKKTSQGSLIQLKISRKTLASMAGTAMETAVRALSELAEDKLIFLQRREIYIRDLAKCERLAQSK